MSEELPDMETANKAYVYEMLRERKKLLEELLFINSFLDHDSDLPQMILFDKRQRYRIKKLLNEINEPK